MELRHIRYFKAVAEEKNFTRAAEKLAIAQPPLSRQIQDLEAELGTPLFIRSPHKVDLTPEGELFLQYATQILDLVTRSEEDVRERREGLQGTLYIASVEGCGPRLFAGWISSFQKKHPHVQYNLWNGNTDDVNRRLSKGLCEIAMITAPYNTEECHVLPVYEEPWVAVIPHRHPLYSEENAPVKPSELLPYDLLIPSRESRQSEINHWFGDSEHPPGHPWTRCPYDERLRTESSRRWTCHLSGHYRDNRAQPERMRAPHRSPGGTRLLRTDLGQESQALTCRQRIY